MPEDPYSASAFLRPSNPPLLQQDLIRDARNVGRKIMGVGFCFDESLETSRERV